MWFPVVIARCRAPLHGIVIAGKSGWLSLGGPEATPQNISLAYRTGWWNDCTEATQSVSIEWKAMMTPQTNHSNNGQPKSTTQSNSEAIQRQSDNGGVDRGDANVVTM
jgi:hypothetical protein